MLKPELVLDFHTTTAEQPDILITADKNNEVVQRFINSSAVKDITTVAPNFAAYEVPNSHLNDDLYEQICADIARYLDEETVDQERTFYKMTGKILPEEEKNVTSLENFVYNDELQAVLAFLGEEAYKQDGTYAGFRLKVL